MLSMTKCKFVGFNSGSKDGSDWAIAYFDDLVDLMDRTQFFCRGDLIPVIKSLTPGDVYTLSFRVSSRQTTNGSSYSVRLIEVN